MSQPKSNIHDFSKVKITDFSEFTNDEIKKMQTTTLLKADRIASNVGKSPSHEESRTRIVVTPKTIHHPREIPYPWIPLEIIR